VQHGLRRRNTLASSDPHPEPRQPILLVVDDDEDLRELLVRVLSHGQAYRVDQASSAAEARASLAKQAYDVVITDLSMPGEGGLALMEWSHETHPGAAWIVLTGHGTLDAAVAALQLGAFDFLEKPLRGIAALQNAVQNAVAHQQLVAERDRLYGELAERNAQLGEQVELLGRAYGLLRERADKVRADLHTAGVIQRALLPQVAPQMNGLQIHALYRPSQNIGGDLYDVVRLDDRWTALMIADAAGHGLSAAMLAVLFRSQLSLVDPDSGCPLRAGEVLRSANRALCDRNPVSGLFVTAAYCLLDTQTHKATFASAGHPPLILLRSSGETERIYHSGPALGLYAAAEYAELELTLEPGDRLLFHSDGVYDVLPEANGSPSQTIAAILSAEGGEGERGVETLRRLFAPDGASGLAEGAAPEDDVTLLLLDVAPGVSQLDNGVLSPPPAPAPASTTCEILVGSDIDRSIFSIKGRGAWENSAQFHAECVAAIDAGRPILIDMTLCQSLDSSFLGAVHELSERAEQADVELRLQGVNLAVEDLFLELGMTRAMEHVVPRMLPLPTQMEPLASAVDARSRASLTLLVHEKLAGLSDHNRREFDPLLTLLRREVAVASL
jgi:sigma-B regulation protein RsbU (phosphoserine phosphatase)